MIVTRLYSENKWNSVAELLDKAKQSKVDKTATEITEIWQFKTSKRYFEVGYIPSSWYVVLYKKESWELIDLRFSKDKEDLLSQLVSFCSHYWFWEEFYTR